MKNEPIKRHAALAPLSREHQKGLLVAQLCKADAPPYRDLPTDFTGKIQYVTAVYNTLLLPHFRKEEEMLQWINTVHGDTFAEHTLRIVTEHAALQALAAELQTSSADIQTLHEFGILLEKHIRYEERELFMELQKKLSETELLRVAEFH